MARPYSMDLRQRVARAWDTGMDAESVAAKYDVSRAWVHRLIQRRRETGSLAPRQQTKFPIEMTLSSRVYRKVAASDFPPRASETVSFDVKIEQGMVKVDDMRIEERTLLGPEVLQDEIVTANQETD